MKRELRARNANQRQKWSLGRAPSPGKNDGRRRLLPLSPSRRVRRTPPIQARMEGSMHSWVSSTRCLDRRPISPCVSRSEEHTSELQSRQYLVCRLLLAKKKQQDTRTRGLMRTICLEGALVSTRVQ